MNREDKEKDVGCVRRNVKTGRSAPARTLESRYIGEKK